MRANARFCVLALLCFSPTLAAQAAGGGQGLLTPEALVALPRVGEPSLSPDGKRLLYVVRQVDLAADASRATLRLRDLRSGQDREVGRGSQPCWSPDGERFAFVGKDGVHVVLLAAGAEATLPADGGVENLQWSPDGSRFSFTRSVQVDPGVLDAHPDLPRAKARAYDDLMVRHWDHWLDGTRSHLFTMPAEGGKAVDHMRGAAVDTPLQPFGGGEQICWSPDGTRLCYTAKKVADPERSTDSGLYLVDLASDGEHRLLTPGLPGFDQDPAWSPDGSKIAFCSMARGGFEADRVRLMVHDVATGANTELLPDFDASVHGLVFARDGKTVFFTVETQGTTQAFSASLDGGAPRQITTGRHALSALQPSPDGQKLYGLRTLMEYPADLVEIDVATGACMALTEIGKSVFERFALPEVEDERFAATDGKEIQAFIVKPPGFDPSRKYPFVLYCQGGPQSMVGQGFSYRWNFHLMAAKGYVVAAVNRRGLPGFGQAWNDQISKDWGGQAMQDLLSVCDAMQQRPYIDKARSAAVGASFGGFTVYWMMGNAGDRFACMIAHCGVFNLESMYLSTEEQWFVDWDLGGPFWRSPAVEAAYRRFSPHRYVENWRTPLLVIHGEKDFRVPYDQGLQAFTAAQMQGVKSRLLMFPEEGHWVLRPQNGVLWQREFFAWLDRFCKPGK